MRSKSQRELERLAARDWIVRRGYDFDVERTPEREDASWVIAEEVAEEFGVSVLSIVWPEEKYTQWKCNQLESGL